jgi:hypothetical protein
MLFRDSFEESYGQFEQALMAGMNSIEVFLRLKFTEEVVGQEWKERLLVTWILQKIENIRQLRQRVELASIGKNEQVKLLKDLEMEQLKISALINENENLTNRLSRVCHEFQQSGGEQRK